MATTWIHKMAKAVKHFQLHFGLHVFYGKEPLMPLYWRGKAGRGGRSSAPGRLRCWEERPGEQRLNSRDCFLNTVQVLAAAPASCCARRVCAGRLGAAGLPPPQGPEGMPEGRCQSWLTFLVEDTGWRGEGKKERRR